jgi:diaminopimelate decarboxylase
VTEDSGLATRLAVELIEWRSDGACYCGVSLEHLAAESGTPLYVYSAESVERQYDRLRQALPQEVEIYYSIKANPHPEIIKLLIRRGAGCEIASGGEYVIARRADVSPHRIFFAGPGKGADELEYVASNGIGEIHLESLDEMLVLDQIAARLRKRVAVGLRINPSSVAGGALVMGGQPTAFGFPEETLGDVVASLRSCSHLDLAGVHVYTGTQILDAAMLVRHWQHAIEIAKSVADLAGKPLSTVDLGGGLGIPYFARDTELNLDVLAGEAATLITRALSDPRLSEARFVVEPGRFLAGPCGMYVARVRSVKNCRGTTFVVLDGGMNHQLAASGNLGQVVRRDYPIVNLSRTEPLVEEPVVIVGPLCTPIDTLGRKVTIPAPRVGDLIGILQSGAYGLTASPTRFLSHPEPAEALVRNGQHKVITAPSRAFAAAALEA